MNQFYFIKTNNLKDITTILEEKGYFQLLDAGINPDTIVVNTKLKQFWAVDKKKVGIHHGYGVEQPRR